MPITTKCILNQLVNAPHETQVILDKAFALAYEQQQQQQQQRDPKDPVYAAYTAALQWSQQVDDEDMRRAAQVWVARYHVECNQDPTHGFNQLKELAHGGCWQAFFPLAICYLRGVKKSDDNSFIQPVDTTMARQWFSTAAQLDPKTTTDKTIRPTAALAQLHLGILMTQEHDDKKALHWFLKSANNGNAQAQFIVAIHYAMGLGVDISKDKAKTYLEQSAKQGFVHSETALGILYLEDDEYDRALMWLERAEQKGDPRALFRLGLLYKSGHHRRYQTSATTMATVKQDWEKTVHYFKAAAEQGHPGAQFQLALGYQKGNLGLKRNLALADQLIQQSAKAGYTPAQRCLGFMYREGWVLTGLKDATTATAGSRVHCKKSDKMAFQWFYRAAQRHDLYAYILVGQCYEQGRGVPVNRKTALEYYQRASEKENSPCQTKAQHAMADLLLRMGRLSEAYHWFTLAASKQDDIEEEEACDEEQGVVGSYDHWPTRRARLMVARYHLHGWGGVTIDRQRAYSILTELTTHTEHDGHAHYWLATCYLEGIPDVCEMDHAAAFEHYSIAAKTSVLDSEYQLARMYANGIGVESDRSKALAWYKKAAHHGHEDALVILGYHYYTIATTMSQEDVNVKKDNLNQAIQYFEKAADGGNVSAMEQLGDIFLSLAATPTLTLKGKRDRDHQRSRAVHYYTKAASMDYAKAQRELGKLYHAGIGVAQDYERAFALFSRAATQNDPAATLLLGNCYEHGHGTTQDHERALELYQRSAKLNYPFASFAAAQLYNELNRIHEAYTQYKITANDHRLESSTTSKAAQWMMCRYILDYDDTVLFGETKQDAFKMLSHLAITDNGADPFTPAFYWLAYCFQYGLGTSIDLVQAIKWYQKAIEEDDHVEALVQLGLIHSQGGPGVPVDQEHAIDLIQRAAEQGHPAGQYQLGMAYWRGLHSITIDEEKATRLFQDAATQGYGHGHWALGEMAYEKNDKTMALHCWRNGTQQGDPSSMRCQAQLLLEHMPQDDTACIKQQYMDAMELLTGAAQAGDTESHFYLGRIYLAEAALLKTNAISLQEQSQANREEHSMMIQQQHDDKIELAKQYLEKAAMTDHVEAMFLSAQIWHEQQQYATALVYYERAAEQNHPLARVMRARYLLGNGISCVNPDPQAAYKELVDCAENQECVEAYHSLGQCHEHGLGTKQDYLQAIDWYLKSAQATSDAEALYRIGSIYAHDHVSPPPDADNRSNAMEAHHWFEMACRIGNHARAHYHLGLYYLDGIKDQVGAVLLNPSQDIALHHLQLAAKQNDCDAMLMLGTLFDDEKWLHHAAQLGSRDALCELGKLYYLGTGTTEEQDFEQAYKLFHQAASLGDCDAAMFVGTFHEHGIHPIVPDLKQALRWYQVAANNDQPWMAELAMARVLHQLPGMHARAYACFQAAYEHAPNDTERTLPDIMMARYRLHKRHTTCTDEEQRDAMTTLLKYANEGDARVFYEVALCYENGHAVDKNMDKAFQWYSRLEQFHAQLSDDAQDMLQEELQEDISKALYRLAEFYRNGTVTNVDLDKAAALEQCASLYTEENPVPS
ncbi:HCP-like protein [Lichtheimia hyalospora FSU 10163]|nr:HCP-like protein [Lichtheimia hyalospora FSU 10163]